MSTATNANSQPRNDENDKNSPASDTATLFARRLHHLRTSLCPLLSVTTDAPHPAFPPTILHYHLLTEAELNELAHFYHQSTPTAHSVCYPMSVVHRWKVPDPPDTPTPIAIDTTQTPAPTQAQAGIEAKRRRFGRFLGLRGCESPGMWREEEAERRAMEMWVAGEMRRREERDAALALARRKGGW
ncbi:MAG: hypothetical protein LQ351_000468 [Letrouitia transgressa]|nr:MAG: hypothetical protein LQ351_000468 [Letrouitia transgressa]